MTQTSCKLYAYNFFTIADIRNCSNIGIIIFNQSAGQFIKHSRINSGIIDFSTSTTITYSQIQNLYQYKPL